MKSVPSRRPGSLDASVVSLMMVLSEQLVYIK